MASYKNKITATTSAAAAVIKERENEYSVCVCECVDFVDFVVVLVEEEIRAMDALI